VADAPGSVHLGKTGQDYTIVEISERLGYYQSGVERVRAAIRALLQAMMADDRPTGG
jgi:hypothetical protein